MFDLLAHERPRSTAPLRARHYTAFEYLATFEPGVVSLMSDPFLACAADTKRAARLAVELSIPGSERLMFRPHGRAEHEIRAFPLSIWHLIYP